MSKENIKWKGQEHRKSAGGIFAKNHCVYFLKIVNFKSYFYT